MAELDHTQLQEAANGLLQSVILGSNLGEALQSIASAGHAHGTGITKSVGDVLTAVPSLSMKACLQSYQSCRYKVPLANVLLQPSSGSLFTSDIGSTTVLQRTIFYQEFMRPMGISRRAAMQLPFLGPGSLRFVFYRSDNEGAFLPEETQKLDQIAPHLQAAATICQTTVDKRASDQLELFSRQGLAVFRLGADGRVVDRNEATDSFVPDLLGMTRGRVTLRLNSEQVRLDQAISAALGANCAPTILRVGGTVHCLRPMILVIPVNGPALDVFASTLALLVVIDATHKLGISPHSLDILGHSISLTPREKAVVAAVAAGEDLATAARQLDIAIGTVRNHLKAAMQKAGVHSQVELAALVAQLSKLLSA
jgi:DNA-binding CsgD family transcriptional regulator